MDLSAFINRQYKGVKLKLKEEAMKKDKPGFQEIQEDPFLLTKIMAQHLADLLRDGLLEGFQHLGNIVIGQAAFLFQATGNLSPGLYAICWIMS